jgi:multidrug efflux pump subunit AcrB
VDRVKVLRSRTTVEAPAFRPGKKGTSEDGPSGPVLVLVVLMCFLVSFRAAVIVALTIPLSLLFSFIFLHAQGIAANLSL